MNKKFVERLKELRGTMSQEEFAAKIGEKQTSYSAWERGAREPVISVLENISNRLGVSSDWLLGLSDVRTTSKTVDEAARGVRSRLKVLDPNQALRAEIDALKRRMNVLESSTSLATCG